MPNDSKSVVRKGELSRLKKALKKKKQDPNSVVRSGEYKRKMFDPKSSVRKGEYRKK